MESEATSTTSSRERYDDLKQLTPLLATELDHLRTALREHNLWLQRYGQSDAGGSNISSARLGGYTAAPPTAPLGAPPPALAEPPLLASPLNTSAEPLPPPHHLHPPPPALPPPGGTELEFSHGFSEASAAATAAAASGNASPPPYSASDVPDYSRSDASVRYEVAQRRDQLMEWLKEGEDLLRDYSARFAQLAEELHLPAEDVLGTWSEAASDNVLPGYTMIEPREELMVGNVGEVPPNYVRSPGGNSRS